MVSKLEFPLPLWRYLLLFQSWRQVRSWIIIVVATAFVVCGILKYIDVSFFPLKGALLGTIFGSLISVVMVVPVEFSILRRTRKVSESLTNMLDNLGYVVASQTREAVVYEQNLPRCFRWDEGSVFVESSKDKIVVKGAWFILANLRLRVKKEFGGA